MEDKPIAQNSISTEKAELLKAALLGTQRYELSALGADDGLKALYEKLGADGAETDAPHLLLSLAGAHFLRQRAGTKPYRVLGSERDADGLKGDAAAEVQSPCGGLAGQNLAAILWGYSPDLLPEFLAALAETGQRVPEQYLPTLLARGAKTTAVRSAILPVLGQTGRWLANQNPEWAYATGDAATHEGAQALLRTLPHAKRQPYLRQLRHTNPPLARDILQSLWKLISNSDRAAYVKVLSDGLSIADEPFLEQALDDRNNVVRRKAAELLAMLPESQLCSRVTERAEGFLNWEPESENRIVVRFPKEITPQMVRDGVMIRKLRDESRVRAYLMKEIVGAIPLSHWTTTWQTSPNEIIAAARSSRWPRTLKQAFVIAAERQKNVEWAKALLADDKYGVSSIRLINLLSIEDCETILLDAEKYEVEKDAAARDAGETSPKPPLSKDSLFVRILRKRREPWTEQIFKRWLDRLVEHLDYDLALRASEEQSKKRAATEAVTEVAKDAAKEADKDRKPKNKQHNPAGLTGVAPSRNATTVDPILRLLIRQSGRCCPVELVPQVVDRLRPYSIEFTVWRPIIQELISTIKFRQTMLKNIKVAEGQGAK